MKRFSVFLSVIFLAALVLSACGPSAPAATPTPEGPVGDPAHGQQAYTGTCVTCHGPDARGIPGLGKDLTASDFAKNKTNNELITFIQTGRPASDPLNTTGVDMPPKGGNPALTEQDIVDIVAYLRTLQP